MKKKLTFLGIETSCDETASAIIKENDKGTADVLSNVVSSQIKEHENYGGVVPELAARAHVENIDFVVNKAVYTSGIKLEKIDGIAATAGPGLVVCLSIGLNFGKTISKILKKPLIAVNHLEGHALSPGLENKIKFPYLLLLVSGGHSQYLIVQDVNSYVQLGTTIDDALGEAFDKTAKMLNLGFPGGPNVEKFARLGKKDSYKLPLPIINRAGCNLSFAGLKTAVLREAKKINSDKNKANNLAASFQETVIKILEKKTLVAIKEFKKKYKKNNCLVVAGGVASNQSIRERLKLLCKKENFNCIFPNQRFCGDNAAMIAWAGIKRFKKNLFNDEQTDVRSRWPLDLKAPFLKGPGLKL